MPATVLVVDDDTDARELVRTYLAFAGFESIPAAHGGEGLDALREHRPCLIVLDLNMPVMSGWEFRARQKQLPDRRLADTPVVIVSALPDCAEQAKQLGAAEAICKPLDLDDLVHAVRYHCGRRLPAGAKTTGSG